MQCTKCGADLQPGATVCPSCEERVVPTRKSVAAPRKRPAPPVAAAPIAASVAGHDSAAPRAPRASGRPAWYLPALIAAVVVVVAISGWVVFSVFNTGANTPEAAALRMMQAYATYDARAILDNVTHTSLTATDQATFEKQAADTKATNKGLAAIKDIKVTKVTIDPKNPNSATVQLSEMILDPLKGTYAARNETLSLVKQSGKWLVKLF
jgi:hypothetical protein